MPERGSLNADARLDQGWVCGGAKYANTEPHHLRTEGGAWVYAEMHDPALERLLCLVLDGIYETAENTEYAPTEVKVDGINVVTYTDDPEDILDDDPCYLLRAVGGVVEEVQIPADVLVTNDGSDCLIEEIPEADRMDGRRYRVKEFDASLTREYRRGRKQAK